MTADVLTRYQQARTIALSKMSTNLVLNDAVFPHWIDADHFWYWREAVDGATIQMVDVKAASSAEAFDHEALTKALTQEAGQPVEPGRLPLRNVSIETAPLRVRFQAIDKHWLYEPATRRLQQDATPTEELLSPDGSRAVFVREHNLWVRQVATGEEAALTQDGAADYAYATDHFSSGVIQAAWSPDSKRIFTALRDSRKVPMRTVIQYVPQDGSLRPCGDPSPYTQRAYPGDKDIETYRLVVVDVESGKVQQVDYEPLPLMIHADYLTGFFSAGLAWWAADNQQAYFIDLTRGSKKVRVVGVDVGTGATNVLFEETSDTFISLSGSYIDPPQIMPLPESDELIWISERSGWAHFYLYDLKTGALKNAITQGSWRVRELLHFDPVSREALVQTAGRDPKVSPYYRDVCRVNVDTGVLTPVVAGSFEHSVYRPYTFPVVTNHIVGLDSADVNGVSPDGRYVVVTRSRVDTVPVSLLLDRNGKELLTLETADVSRLPVGWQWPEPVKVKGADQQTDIYGVVFRPPGFSPNQSYPIVNYSNSMRCLSTFPQGSFVNSSTQGEGTYVSPAALAALGFIVVVMDGRGTPHRDKAFHDHNYGDPSSNSDLTDRIAGLTQLAKKYPYMDLERVGITGDENPSNSIYGLLQHPEFFKVVVVQCLSDARFMFSPAYSETYGGVSFDGKAGPTVQYAESFAGSLKGKLLLVAGMLSLSATSSTFHLVETLQKANKDFEMLCMPNMRDEVTPYTLRREWDFLVRHLQGVEPPREFDLTTGQAASS